MEGNAWSGVRGATLVAGSKPRIRTDGCRPPRMHIVMRKYRPKDSIVPRVSDLHLLLTVTPRVVLQGRAHRDG